MNQAGPNDSAGSGQGGAERAAEEAQVAQWVRAAQEGDRDALARIIECYQDRVWRRARYRIGDPDEAWEVTQDVFIICLRKIGQYRGDAPFWFWLMRIVDNQVRNRQGWWRRRRRAQTFSLEDLGGQAGDDEKTAFDPPDSAPSPRQEAAGREAFAILETKMGELSAEHREILLLRFADGLAYEEIAATLDISLGTVKSRINRARAELREKMKDYI
ncbi:MAG: sigma-70 family RNA polymerase sigma factor [bacterium]|nr:sigma-70 family RNA polymerase sigma factor [bacterium]